MRKARSDMSMGDCIICMSPIPRNGKGSTKFSCSLSSHCMCKPCYKSMVLSRVQRSYDELTETECECGEIMLPCTHTTCTGQFNLTKARLHLNGEEWATFDINQRRLRDRVVEQKAHAEAERDFSTLLAQQHGSQGIDLTGLKRIRDCQERSLERSLKHTFRNPRYNPHNPRGEPEYNAFMCPRCKTGPISRDDCTDLQAHHGQSNGRGGTTSNACAHCGFFAVDSHRWARWDGRVRIGGNPVGGGSPSTVPAVVAVGALPAAVPGVAVASVPEQEDDPEQDDGTGQGDDSGQEDDAGQDESEQEDDSGDGEPPPVGSSQAVSMEPSVLVQTVLGNVLTVLTGDLPICLDEIVSYIERTDRALCPQVPNRDGQLTSSTINWLMDQP